MMKWIPYNFQNLMTSQTMSIDWLNDYIFMFLFFILVAIAGILLSLIFNSFTSMKFYESPVLEFFWTVFPGIILLLIGVPSLAILYGSESFSNYALSVKIAGNQWYWSYDYSDFPEVVFDSYLKPMSDLAANENRLLQTDNSFVVPLNTNTQLLVSSTDVLHSWAMPPMGVKADANPGRLNTLFLNNLDTPGLFFGQCSEICGANHSFMPITMEVTSFTNFILWLKTF